MGLERFLLNDTNQYHAQLLAFTYLLESTKETVAFFSMLNEKISILDVESTNQWRKNVRDRMPQGKRFRRLGDYNKHGVGKKRGTNFPKTLKW